MVSISAEHSLSNDTCTRSSVQGFVEGSYVIVYRVMIEAWTSSLLASTPISLKLADITYLQIVWATHNKQSVI